MTTITTNLIRYEVHPDADTFILDPEDVRRGLDGDGPTARDVETENGGCDFRVLAVEIGDSISTTYLVVDVGIFGESRVPFTEIRYSTVNEAAYAALLVYHRAFCHELPFEQRTLLYIAAKWFADTVRDCNAIVRVLEKPWHYEQEIRWAVADNVLEILRD